MVVSMSKRKRRTLMPMGTAGLLSFQTEESGGIKIKPWMVVAATIGIVTAEVIIRLI